jgi:hypothetical protein
MIFSSLWAAFRLSTYYLDHGAPGVPLSLRYRATSLRTGPKIAQAALQFRRISSHCLNTAANLD